MCLVKIEKANGLPVIQLRTGQGDDRLLTLRNNDEYDSSNLVAVLSSLAM